MGKRSFSKQLVKDACMEYTTEEGGLVLHYRDTSWKSEGEYQTRLYVLKEIATGKLYGYVALRSRSPFTDWSYSFEWNGDMIELNEVHEVEVVTKQWRYVDEPQQLEN